MAEYSRFVTENTGEGFRRITGIEIENRSSLRDFVDLIPYNSRR